MPSGGRRSRGTLRTPARPRARWGRRAAPSPTRAPDEVRPDLCTNNGPRERPVASCSSWATFVASASQVDDVWEVAMATLYERLGGLDAITAVVDSFVTRCAADDRINGKFVR